MSQGVSQVLVCLDLTAAALAEASQRQCDAVVCYHPPFLKGPKTLCGNDPLVVAVRHKMAVYSPHTAWDVAPGGANDALGDALGLQPGAGRRALRLAAAPAPPLYKLVVFVPETAAETVSAAAYAAGAGHIGAYAQCSFRSLGTATFVGAPGSHPAIGEPERLCRTSESRLEVVVPQACLEAVRSAVCAAHPYEEPAVDLYCLAPPPPQLGTGRFGALQVPRPAAQLLAELKAATSVPSVLHAAPPKGAELVRRAAVCVGAGDALLEDVLRHRCEVYVTGELRHHAALRATAQGCHVICMRHASSESLGLQALQRRLQAAVDLPVWLSQTPVEPFDFA